jgi:hypothetical protein
MPFDNQRRRGRKFIFFPLMFILMILLLGAIVMMLWNAILPDLIQARTINYWQAVGLLALCRILFGNFRRSFGGPPSRGGPWKEKWMKMTPEERSRFREAWKERCRQERK